MIEPDKEFWKPLAGVFTKNKHYLCNDLRHFMTIRYNYGILKETVVTLRHNPDPVRVSIEAGVEVPEIKTEYLFQGRVDSQSELDRVLEQTMYL